MQKIPMQIYIDQESLAFYRAYARRRAISFAAAVREALKEREKSLRMSAVPEKNTHPLVTAILNAQATLATTPYHHPDKSDDELLYG